MGIPFIAALGIAAAIVVVCAVAVSIGFTPAVLGLIGTRIDKLSLPGVSNGHDPDQNGIWFRWTRLIQRRPIVFGGFALIVLLVLAIPFLNMRLGSADEGNNPASLHTRRAYDLLAEAFGPGYNGTLLITVEKDGGLDQAVLTNLETALKGANGVVSVAAPATNPAGDTAVIQVTPAYAPQDKQMPDLVKNLRDNVIPPVVANTGSHVYVGGGTAAFVDIGDKISSRMPLFFVIVIGLSILVLMTVFRSIVIPIKAAIFNLLSIGAAYGVVVAVFQWGWGASLFGVEKKGPIESFLPMMLFAILFGLAMDYEVFLLSRIHEEYLHGKSARDAIQVGLGVTARVIFAAALIMMAVFFSFVREDTRIIKEFGLGLGVAILVELLLIRLFLFPAVMTLLDDKAWYMPRWLDRVLPRLNIEGPTEAPEAPSHEQPSFAPSAGS